MRHRRWASFLAAIACAAAAGCAAPPGALDGSISASFDLRYDRLLLALDEGAFVIRYDADVAFAQVDYAGTNTVAELRFADGVGDVEPGVPVDVTGLLELNRYVMALSEGGDVVHDDRGYPPVYTAEATFDVLGAGPGEPCAGRFRVIFEDGTTLRGEFDGVLEDAAW